MANIRTINKSLSSVIFSDYPELLIRIDSLGDSMVSISLSEDSTQRLATPLGDILSPNFVTRGTVSVDILKVSEVYHTLVKMIKTSNILSGSVVVALDDGTKYKLDKITFDIGSISGAGNEASADLTLTGNMKVNQNYLL